MDNQHRKITGYRELAQAEIDLINEIKRTGERLQVLCNEVRHHLTDQKQAAIAMRHEDPAQAEYFRIVESRADYWLNEGTRSLQLGLMCVTRAVAQPTTF
jgi:hypothetical protein